MSMANTGQRWLQPPQPLQSCSFTTAFLSMILMANEGHTLAHVPQPMHFSLLTTGRNEMSFIMHLPPA
jgi:hypothetical protein